MKQGQDIAIEFPGAVIIHQKIQHYEVEEHIHEEHELFLPLQGEITVQALGQELKAGPGKMLYLPAGTPHTFQSGKSGQGERLIFILTEKLWKGSEGGTFGPRVVSASQLCQEILFHLLLHPQTKAARSLLQTLVQTISEMLEEAPAGHAAGLAHLKSRSQDTRLQKALDQIETRFTENISAETLSRASGMSVRTLNRLFLQELGATPKQILMLRRVEEARRLLAKRGSTVTDVAFAVGYNSVSQFITVFRKATGQLPSSVQAH